jgi:hypothetical protein
MREDVDAILDSTDIAEAYGRISAEVLTAARAAAEKLAAATGPDAVQARQLLHQVLQRYAE